MQELPIVSPGTGADHPPPRPRLTALGSVTPNGHHHHRQSLSDVPHVLPIAPAVYSQEVDPMLLRNSQYHTSPDTTMPMTPLMPHMPHMEHFVAMTGPSCDLDGDHRFLHMNATQVGIADFDPNMMADFMTSPALVQDPSELLIMNGKGVMHMANHMTMPSSTAFHQHIGLKTPPHRMLYKLHSKPSPSTSSMGSLQEPDAVLASHSAWPYFQSHRVEKYSFFPPKTAAIYLEGLAQTLRNQATWQAWTASLDERSLDISTERKISTEPIVGWSREKLLAITQGFLHKALDIHKISYNRDDTPTSPGSTHEAFLMLPPPEVMQYFLRSYVVRYEPYYSSIPGGRLDPNSLMHSSNSKAASLLILLMVASGATSTATPEARYVASGLTEACRVSLLDTVEKDIAQAREVLFLRSALLLICLAAWSGDKWHMDMAMGQRGLYLAMLAHAGTLDVSGLPIDMNECRLDPERAWEDWKEHEGRHRLAHSWIIVDQEISLFSDSTPQLSIVDLHVPIPDTDDLWHAASSLEWLALFERTHGAVYHSPASVKEFFTKFVDGDLAGRELSPTQLRLLLHPLQAQVCQLRQFIACLPDSGRNASRAVSKAATKARLEEISALLQQWYAISKGSFSGQNGTCWTTCANLVMYHLISLNAITSFKCIEQFARREVILGPFGHAAWLQSKCIDHAEEALFHCGQILRLIRSMPKPVRPPWWAGAVYRVAMAGWATAMSRTGRPGPPTGEPIVQFAIDDLTPEHELNVQYTKYQKGEPMLSSADGTLIPMYVPSNVLKHCIEVLEDDSSMRLADGIKRKLRMFAESWKDN